MSSTFSVSELLADVATLSNVPPFGANTHVKESRVTYWLAQSARSLSALLRQHLGADRDFVQVRTITTAPDYPVVSLPSDCGEVHAVLWLRDERDYVLLRTAQIDDLAPDLEAAQGWVCPPTWRLEGETIALFPTSAEAETLEVYYTTHVATGTGTFQARIDFDRWVTQDVCAQVAIAKKRDPSAFWALRDVLEKGLLSRARAREPHATQTIRDVRARPRNPRWWNL